MKYPTFITIFLLFLLSSGRGREISEMVDSTTEVYEIDYRGPETHSSIPPSPPGHLHGQKKPFLNVIHKGSITESPKSKRVGNNNMRRKEKTVHG